MLLAVAAIAVVLTAFTTSGCGAGGHTQPPSPRFSALREASLPKRAHASLQTRSGVEQAHCSTRIRVIKRAVGAHPAIDFVALPTRACVVELRDRGTVDFFGIRGGWTRVGR
jgi:hypothetical protein